MTVRWSLGDVVLQAVVDLDPFRLPLPFLFPGATVEALAEAQDWLAGDHVDFERAEALLAVQSHVVRVAGLTILVDTCVGEGKHRPRRPEWHLRAEGGYLARLAAIGLRPADADIVLCTHLHADHVGWNTRLENGRWVPTFPNARYLMGARELAHWTAAVANAEPGILNHGAYEDSVLPVVKAGRAETVEDGFEIARGATIRPLPGHTPGQIGLRIDSKGRACVLCGDAVHNPLQLHRPDWSSAFCSDGAGAEATRRALLDEAADGGALLVPAHLRGAAAMGATRSGEAYRPVFHCWGDDA